MKWKYKIWILLVLAILVVLFTYNLNKWLGIIHIIIFAVLFPLVIYRQFIEKGK